MPAIIPVVAAVAGGAIASRGARRAADTQAEAARQGQELGIAENARQFDLVREILAPYVQAGQRGMGAYEGLVGLSGAPAQQEAINAILGGPQFGTLARQGEEAILQNAAATGGLRGGNTQAALADFRSNLLSSLIDRQLGRYLPIIQSGQASAAGTGSAALSTGASNVALINGGINQAGAARAGGQLAGANAIAQAIGGIGGMVAANWPGSTPITANPVGSSTVGMSF